MRPAGVTTRPANTNAPLPALAPTRPPRRRAVRIRPPRQLRSAAIDRRRRRRYGLWGQFRPRIAAVSWARYRHPPIGCRGWSWSPEPSGRDPTDGTNLEGGRCDGSEEGGGTVGEEGRRRRAGVQEGPDQPAPRRPPPSAPSDCQEGRPRPRRRPRSGDQDSDQEDAPRRPRGPPRRPRSQAAGGQEERRGRQEGGGRRSPPAATKAARRRPRRRRPGQGRGRRPPPSGPPSAPTPRTPSSSTNSAPCSSRSAASTAARPWTCGPRPTPWPSSASPATSSSTRSRARAARSPSTVSATWRCRPRRRRRSRRSTTPSARSIARPTADASDATRPSPRPGSGRLPFARLCVACKSGGLSRR